MVDKTETLSLRDLSSTRPPLYQGTRSTLQPLADSTVQLLFLKNRAQLNHN